MTDSLPLVAVVERLLPAPPDTVYDAWLDRTVLAEFMCPDPGRAVEVECEPWLGGRLRILMRYPGGTSLVLGQYLELDRPRRIRFTWTAESVFDSVVTVTLEPYAQHQTRMTITHTGLLRELATAYDDGWTRIAGHLADRLEAGQHAE